ncbi:putative bifunctional diguanylate cyclase/phosphodiesterase [Paenibacillus camerounensis]|uniref:putative bifunctional diguanylate cyclase/phosphodiesterase n=1 Tax=Paenibacillus camerounensis TaxID=1243663 RepID=UPI000694D10A|nr:EAL domain-containing protein [Paenibacillus camerounensis]
MKLSRKIIIFIVAVALFGLGVTYLLLHFILLNRFEKLDEAALRSKLDNVVSSYQSELQTLKTGLLKYSTWDDTYRFMQEASPAEGAAADKQAYLDSNFSPAAYAVNQFDMMALLDITGQPRYGGIYNPGTGAVASLTPEYLTLFELIHSRLAGFMEGSDSRSGIVLLKSGPMMITLSPIINNSGDRPVIGTAVAGRMLQQEEISRIWDETRSSLRMTVVHSAPPAESQGEAVWISSDSDKMMSIHSVVSDLFGNPALEITLQQPREIYENGLQSVISFRKFFLIWTLLMCIASLLFVRHFILRRMSILVRNIRAIGSSKDLSIRVSSPGKDEFSEVEHEFNRMIDSLQKAQEELQLQSMLDPLTQLPNRSLFFTRLNEAIASARETGRQIGLVFIDLDHFKTVNDTLGHDFGDAMLKETAFRISRVIGKHDVVSRLGGDEFTILLADAPDADSLKAQLSRIQEALSIPHRIQGHLLYNTASIGVSIYPQNGEDADYLVKQADLAMFHVKESGRNNILQYSEELEESIRRRKVLSQLLLSAAVNDEFEVHYQPILGADSLKVAKLEALLRWTNPAYGPVSPAEFIPLAETSGSIISIGSWVLRQVCSDLRRFRQDGLELTAAVNISAVQLIQPGLCELLLALLEEFELPSSSLELEITESVLVSGDHILSSLQELRSYGFRISLDDFGTGFSSLSYLRRFPVDTIKIDRSFVSEMTLEPQGDVLVKTIIELSHNLGLKVVAEGIELKEQFDLLRRLGSDELQGYYISKPLQAVNIYEFLS